MFERIRQSFAGHVQPAAPGTRAPSSNNADINAPASNHRTLAERQGMYNAACNGARFDKKLYDLVNTRVRCESGVNYELITRPDRTTAQHFGLEEGRSQQLGSGNYSTSIRLARLADQDSSAELQYLAAKKIYGSPSAAKKEFDVHVALADHDELAPSAYLVQARDVALISEGKSYIFMEALAGPDGERALAQLFSDPDLSQQQKKELALDTAHEYLMALNEMHKRGYRHGDVDNIKNFFHDEQTGRIALGDYGHASPITTRADQTSDLAQLGKIFRIMHRAAEQAGIAAPGLALASNALVSGRFLGGDILASWSQVEEANKT